MKKVIAVIVVVMLVMGCATVYAEKAYSTSKTSKARSGKGGFFNELADLFQRRIPETPKSDTHNLWKTDKQKAAGCGSKTK